MFFKRLMFFTSRFVLILILASGWLSVDSARAESMEFGWAQGWGGSNMDYGTAIAIAGNGDVLSTGFTTVNIPMDRDITIARLDVNGNYLWSHVIGDAADDSGRTISTDADGNVYIAGVFSGTVDFDPGLGVSEWTSLGLGDIFILKLDSNGNFIWCKGLGGADGDGATSIIATGEYLYLLGFFSETVDFDPGAEVNNLTSQGSSDVFISKLDNNGDFIWTKSFGGASHDNSFDIEMDGSGNLLITGYVSGTVDLDPGTGVSTFTGAAGNNFFISKLDSNGDLIWTSPGGVVPNAAGIELAIDQNGASHVTGYHTLAGSNNIFVMKVDADGNPLWLSNMGGTGYDTGYGIAVDGDGNVYTTGDFADTVDFDPGPGTSNLTSEGVGDVFVSKMDVNGNFVWAKRLGGTGPDLGEGIAIDSNGRVYLMGLYSDTVDFDLGTGTHNLTSAGNFDIFVSKLMLTPQIYYVDQNANGNNDGTSWDDAFTDLQSALAAASSGDEVWVAAGTYKPTTGTDRAVSFNLKNGVAVYGGFTGAETEHTQRNPVSNLTILSGDIGTTGNSGDNSYHVLIGSDTNNETVLDGFTIAGGYANGTSPQHMGGGIYMENGNLRVDNATFKDNYAVFGGGGLANGFGNPHLHNVTFDKNTSAIVGGGMFNFEGDPSLTNISFINRNNAPAGGGFGNVNGSPLLENVTFYANEAQNGAGMSNTNGSPVLKNVTFSGNIVSGLGAGMYNDASNPTIVNSIFWGNAGSEIENTNGSNPNITYSIVEGGSAGTGNLDANPMLGIPVNNGGFVQTMALNPESPAIDAGYDASCPGTDARGIARPQASHCDMGAYEDQNSILYVKQNASGANDGTSWVNAYPDLQMALAAASGDDEIWVTEGIYTPTTGTDRTVSFVLKPSVALYGGFAGTEASRAERDHEANLTVLSGDIGIPGNNSDNSYHVVTAGNTDSATLLDGFIVSGGNANGSFPHNSGGGLYNINSAPRIGNFLVMNVVFEDNQAALAGGGMYNSGVLISYGNWPQLYSGSPILRNVLFRDNSAVAGGGGMRNQDNSNPILTDVVFSENTSIRTGGGMENMYYSSPTLTNVTFINNTASGGGAVSNWEHASPAFSNVTFHGNAASEMGGAIANGSSSNPTFINATFAGNSADQGGAIYNDSNSHTTIINSILYGNSGGEIYNFAGVSTVNYSIVQGGYTGTGNLDADPLLGPLQDNGGFTQTMALGAGSPAIDAANDADCPTADQRGVARPQGSHCDIGAFEFNHQIRHVKWNAGGANDGSSWTDAYTDLQSALAAALVGDEIWVAAGTYKPSAGTDRTVSFNLKNGVAVYGGFTGTETLLSQRDYETNVTVLSGDIGVAGNNSDNSYHVVVGSNTDNSAILDGFTITQGNANTPDAGVAHEGGGMYNTNGSPTLSNLIFTNNSAVWGGGIANDNGSHPTLKNITFSGNTTVSPTILPPSGGGIYNSASSPSLENVTFQDNSAEGGGGIFNHVGSSPALVNVTFNGNTAEYGSAIMSRDLASHPILTNVTMYGNSATYSVIDGGTIATMGSLTIQNSILWGNTGGSIADIGPGTPQVSYSIIEGGYEGTGNLDVDPLLGPLQENGGFTQTMALGAGSPAIDAAHDADCPATDQRGVTRPQGDHCDIGAYEYQAATPPVVTSITRASPNFTNAATVEYSVTFSEPVTGVDTTAPFGDFTLTTSGVTGAAITAVSGSGTTYTVTVNTGAGNGTLRLDLVDDDSVRDESNDPLGGVGSNNGDFTSGEEYSIIKSTAKPGIPVLLLPANGVLVNSLSPTLDWKDSNPIAHHYQVQVATNSNFTSLVVNENDVYDSTFTPTLLPGKLYSWRVRAFNVNGVTSGWSVVRTFKTPLAQPTLLSPTEEESLLTDRPTFEWDAVPGATSYILQASRLEDFSALLVNETLNTNEYRMSKDLPQNRTIYWRVRAKTAAVSSPWSAKGSFTTGNPPSVPVLVAPTPGTLSGDYTPRFDWKSSTLPVGTTFKQYEIQVDDHKEFTSPEIDSTTELHDLADSDFTPISALMPNTKYFWRVRAVNTVGAEEHVSGWSPVWSFRTKIAAPGSLTLIPNGSNPLQPSFEWDDAPGSGAITGYTIQISTSASFNTYLVNTTTMNSSYSLLKNLPVGKMIYWRVRVNGANGPSPWSIHQFDTF